MIEKWGADGKNMPYGALFWFGLFSLRCRQDNRFSHLNGLYCPLWLVVTFTCGTVVRRDFFALTIETFIK
jgi:hypothetical protein